jgi:hypothetical protein
MMWSGKKQRTMIFKYTEKQGVVRFAYNPSTQEAEAGSSWVGGDPGSKKNVYRLMPRWCQNWPSSDFSPYWSMSSYDTTFIRTQEAM